MTALQLGSIAVVAEASISGSITQTMSFAGLMQSIHLAIGVVEGIVSAGIILAALKTNISKAFSYTTGAISLLLAGVISNYASSKPDGLEWSLLNMSNAFVEQTQGQIFAISNALQAKTAFLVNLPQSAANITGLLALAAITGILCIVMTQKSPVKE